MTTTMRDDKYSTPHYLLDLQRRASAQHDAQDAARDERDSSRDRTRLQRMGNGSRRTLLRGAPLSPGTTPLPPHQTARRNESSLLGSVFVGVCGALIAGWLLGWW